MFNAVDKRAKRERPEFLPCRSCVLLLQDRYTHWGKVTEGLKQVAELPTLRLHASSEGSLHHCVLLWSATMLPVARLAKTNDQRISSGRLWRTFQVQSPSRVGKARLYLASRQSVELPIPASTHLLRKSSQIQGFITRIKAEPYDQIAGDYCDLFSRRVKEWQSHRGARCKCSWRKLDVAPSRLATISSPDPRDNGGGENSRSIPTMRHKVRQVYPHPVSEFSQAITDSDVSSAMTRPDPSAYDLSEVVHSVSTGSSSCALIVSSEFWHSLVAGANGGYLSGLRPEPNARACRPRPASQVDRERNS